MGGTKQQNFASNFLPIGASIAGGLIQSGISALYNRPVAQMRRLKKAGIHPNAFYEMGNPGEMQDVDFNMTPEGISSSMKTQQDIVFAEELQPAKFQEAWSRADEARHMAGIARSSDQMKALELGIAEYRDEIARRRTPGTAGVDADGNPYVTAGLDSYEKEVLGQAQTAWKEPQKMDTEMREIEAKIGQLEELARKAGIEADKIEAGREYWQKVEKDQAEIIDKIKQLKDKELEIAEFTSFLQTLVNDSDSDLAKAFAQIVAAIFPKVSVGAVLGIPGKK